MSEAVEQIGLTAGGLLRQARQASGLHIAALAVALKVPVSKLEALESDDYAALPDTVFVRALASSVCRTLKLDPAQVLSLLPQSKSPSLASDSAGLNAPVKGTSVRSAGSGAGGAGVPRSVVVVVGGLLLGALAVLYFPRGQAPVVPDLAQPESSPTPPDTPSAEPSSLAPVSQAGSAGDPATATSAALPLPVDVPAAPVSATAMELPSAAAAAAAAPASVAASAPDAVDGSGGPLTLRARAESWVQVRDGAGALALQRKLSAGETVAVSGPLPMAVVVGRADATDVFVRGKAFDLVPVSRENVARFEVK
ncbi:MAG: helix-turn-helix domain-containing protein [Acidovorax sp.]|nr:helix-turn-helix domain-containing protein [Acidovorax sp.]